MIAGVVIHIDPPPRERATHSGSSWRGLIYAKAEPYFSTPMPPEWLPSPRGAESYVRLQSNQKDNQSLQKRGEFCISPRKRALYNASIAELVQIIKECPLPHRKKIDLSGNSIFIVIIRKNYSQAAQVWLRKHLWAPCCRRRAVYVRLKGENA